MSISSLISSILVIILPLITVAAAILVLLQRETEWYAKGKLLATLGFAVLVVVYLLELLLVFSGPVIISIISCCLCAVGFLLMWITKREKIDLAVCGTFVLSIVLSIVSVILFYQLLFPLAALSFLAMAFRAKRINSFFFLLLLCIVVVWVGVPLLFRLTPVFNDTFIGILIYIFYRLIPAVGSLLCLIEVHQDDSAVEDEFRQPFASEESPLWAEYTYGDSANIDSGAPKQ